MVDALRISVDRVRLNRALNITVISLIGLAVGFLSYLLAESLVPSNPSNAGEHDVFLAVRLGYIYTPFIGLFVGWVQRSWGRTLLGAGAGVMIGIVYMFLCESRNFFAIQVSFPCLLGAVLAAVISSNQSSWFSDLAPRFGKGLLAGLILGFVYMFALSLAGDLVLSGRQWNDQNYTNEHIRMMWRAGPFALGVASSLFFPLFIWAVRLNRRKIPSRPNAPDITVPRIDSIEPGTPLEQVGAVAVADHLLTCLLRNAPAELCAEGDGTSVVICHISSKDGRRECFRCSNTGEFRTVLARFGYAYMDSQLYGGYIQRRLIQENRTVMARFFMANGSGAGYWIRVYALEPLIEAQSL